MVCLYKEQHFITPKLRAVMPHVPWGYRSETHTRIIEAVHTGPRSPAGCRWEGRRARSIPEAVTRWRTTGRDPEHRLSERSPLLSLSGTLWHFCNHHLIFAPALWDSGSKDRKYSKIVDRSWYVRFCTGAVFECQWIEDQRSALQVGSLVRGRQMFPSLVYPQIKGHLILSIDSLMTQTQMYFKGLLNWVTFVHMCFWNQMLWKSQLLS